jgi:uncharacterized surface protein with fasciclin (FAS1) repeats
MKTKIWLIASVLCLIAFCKQGSSSNDLGGAWLLLKMMFLKKMLFKLHQNPKIIPHVKAVQTAGLVDSLANPDPFTVFAYKR